MNNNIETLLPEDKSKIQKNNNKNILLIICVILMILTISIVIFVVKKNSNTSNDPEATEEVSENNENEGETPKKDDEKITIDPSTKNTYMICKKDVIEKDTYSIETVYSYFFEGTKLMNGELVQTYKCKSKDAYDNLNFPSSANFNPKEIKEDVDNLQKILKFNYMLPVPTDGDVLESYKKMIEDTGYTCEEDKSHIEVTETP